MQRTLTFKVNGETRSVTTDPRRFLLEVLREDLRLTGAKYGCGERQCGACTVLVNNRPVFSCSTRVATANNREILTIEGLADGEKLHPVQEAFLECSAFQCAFCTTGMIMNAVAVLNETPEPSEEEIRKKMDRNLCRCGTYPRIVQAVARAAELGKGGEA